MATTKWQGVFPAVTTKFKENEDLDHPEMERHFAFQIENGVHGLVTCGSLGEASTLSFEEKLEVTKTALAVADKRVPVLVNVSETRTRNACRFVEQAAAMGVQGFMVMPSVLYQLMKAKRWDEALKLYQWFMPLMHLDVSNKLVQNLKLVETLVGVGNENVRRPRQPLSGTERERVTAIVRAALETRPDLGGLV